MDRGGRLARELLVTDHLAERGEVRAAAPSQFGDPVLRKGALEHRVAAREFFGTGDDGVRQLGHGART